MPFSCLPPILTGLHSEQKEFAPQVVNSSFKSEHRLKRSLSREDNTKLQSCLPLQKWLEKLLSHTHRP